MLSRRSPPDQSHVGSAGYHRTAASITIVAWKPLARGSLLGFATAALPLGMIVHDVAVHRKGDAIWASPPGKPQIGRDGTPIRDSDGKVQYSQIITFSDEAARGRFSDGVLAALRASHPEALT
jgi:hypothetical protein